MYDAFVPFSVGADAVDALSNAIKMDSLAKLRVLSNGHIPFGIQQVPSNVDSIMLHVWIVAD